ncbi:NADH dehydrogenase [ubiquinone] 1 alpha subcomplex subunit 2-like [Oppia nitens]|uniref:NADH dehydrogenase [ubiquinone] 1 alpha subcomplex subunit 2-like n=1 Tax=Oppia nitens TaxID=1686743 RepID=UPI0023DA6A53|nr:NADH dehydrogenase [ubiquinone] 1 alpha subcomplex subunit 2-like [Oppia nitens]
MSLKAITRFGPHLKEVRLHLCLTTESSAGVREFISKHYHRVKQTNPNLPILIREAKDIEPMLWIRFEYGRERNVSVTGLSGDQLLQTIQDLAIDRQS